jgi:hypothetical protein
MRKHTDHHHTGHAMAQHDTREAKKTRQEKSPMALSGCGAPSHAHNTHAHTFTACHAVSFIHNTIFRFRTNAKHLHRQMNGVARQVGCPQTFSAHSVHVKHSRDAPQGRQPSPPHVTPTGHTTEIWSVKGEQIAALSPVKCSKHC